MLELATQTQDLSVLLAFIQTTSHLNKGKQTELVCVNSKRVDLEIQGHKYQLNTQKFSLKRKKKKLKLSLGR